LLGTNAFDLALVAAFVFVVELVLTLDRMELEMVAVAVLIDDVEVVPIVLDVVKASTVVAERTATTARNRNSI